MKKVAIIHLGAREYYSIPRMLLAEGHEVRVYTDLYSKGMPSLFSGLCPQIARREHPGLPAELVQHYPMFAWAYSRALKKADSALDIERVFHDFGATFAHLCLPDLKRFKPDVIISFSSTAYEIFRVFKGQAHLILDQIDGGIEEDRIVQEEKIKFPEWEKPESGVADFAGERHLSECEMADRIVVNSPFSRDCLLSEGVHADKIEIIPLAFEKSEKAFSTHTDLEELRKTPIKLIFLGQVCLRKGIHYLDQAMDLLKADGCDVELTIAGPSTLREEKLEQLKAKYSYLGIIPKKDIFPILSAHDILVLPSIAEGFGLVQLEALSAGCRIVTTTNAGDVVDSAGLGQVCEPRQPVQIAEAIKQISQEMNETQMDHFTSVVNSRLRDFSISSISAFWEKVI